MPSDPYQEFLEECEQLLQHKWLMSEKAGKDVGFEAALLDWAHNHRSQWRKERNLARQGESKSGKSSA